MGIDVGVGVGMISYVPVAPNGGWAAKAKHDVLNHRIGV